MNTKVIEMIRWFYNSPIKKYTLAIAMVFLLSLYPVISYPLAKSTILFLLGILILTILFDIHMMISKHSYVVSDIYEDQEHAKYDILEYVWDCAKISGDFSIKIIAISMSKTWPIIRDEILGKTNSIRGKIHFQFIVSDPQYLREGGHITWATNVELLEKQVCQEIKDYSKNNKINFELKFIKQISPKHGLLINDNILFTGRYDWNVKFDIENKEKLRLVANPGEYRRYLTTGNTKGKYVVKSFIDWFEYYERISFKKDLAC